MNKRSLKIISRLVLIFVVLSAVLTRPVFAEASAIIPSGFELVAETGRLCLSTNLETGEIAVLDKNNGVTWFSNPRDREGDKLAKGVPKLTLASQLTVKFVDEKNSVFNITSQLNSVSKGGLTYEKIENGIVFTMDFQKEQFKIPVRYTLKGDYLSAEILAEQITEYGNRKIISIGLLPYFGAGGTNEEGYLFVPDGSGAIINFNNGKRFAAEYQEPVYGIDYIYDRSYVNSVERQIRMPVFGISKKDAGILAVIDENEAQGIVRASISGRLTSYNNVYSEFQYRSMGSMKLAQKNFSNKDVAVVERTAANKGSYKVRYYFLSDGSQSYTGMADTYRNYLISEKGLKSSVKDGNIPFYLDLYGYVTKKKPFLGIPFDRNVPLTTFEDAETILNTLTANGITRPIIRYNGWLKGSYYGKLPSGARVEKKLGGEKGLKALTQAAGASGGQVYLNVDFLNVYKTGNGFSQYRDPAMNMVNTPAMQYEYSINVYDKNHTYEPWYLLSMRSLPGFFDRFLNSFRSLGAGNLALDSIGSMVYSDLGLKPFERYKVPGVYSDILGKATADSTEIMVNGGNAYTLPYTSHIIDSPVYSSLYDIEDEAVPFYQIVLHGIISYSSPAINLSSNPRLEILRCLENGSSPLYSWVGRNVDELKNSRLNFLYSSDYRNWMDQAVKDYKEVNDILSSVITKSITDHRKLAEGVYQTTYGNSTRIIINYNSKSVSINGDTIEALDYIVK